MPRLHIPALRMPSRLLPPPRGFTLIEALIVVSIMGMLLTLAGMGASRMLDPLRMKEAVETTRNQIELARQVAMTHNQEIIFRFYELPDDQGVPAWRAMEFGVAQVETDPGSPDYEDLGGADFAPAFQRMGSIERLPPGYVFHPSATYSTLLNSGQLHHGTDTAPQGDACKFVAFVCQPEARCDLQISGTPPPAWTLTIVKEAEAGGSALPANYSTLVLDPGTARVRVYRP